jgi:hypothetical protein
MLATRRFLTLLLLVALLAPSGLRGNTSGCPPQAAPAQATGTADDLHPDSGSSEACRSHHSGTESLPGGMHHCTISLDCASGPALPATFPERRELVTNVLVRPLPVAPFPADSPEPQAPPPRSC